VAIDRKGRISRVSHGPGGLRHREEINRMLKRVCGGAAVDGAVLSSVVPTVNRTWVSVLRQVCGAKPIVVSHKLKLNVRISYPRPSTIGADRIANACGAVSRYGAPVIVADFGTALTFDVVSKEAAYTGGVITPGLPFMTDYLAEKTALLPHIRLEGACGRIGKSTAGAMRIGARVGYRGMVREIVEHLRSAPGMKGAQLCATGGYAKLILEDMNMPFVLDPHLTLYGLGRIFELNRA